MTRNEDSRFLFLFVFFQGRKAVARTAAALHGGAAGGELGGIQRREHGHVLLFSTTKWPDGV